MIAAAAALLLPWSALAQQPAAAPPLSVEVSPLRLELQAGPGSTTTQAITVTNAGKEAIRVRATLSDWDLSREGAPQFESAAVDGPYSATRWVRVAPPEQIIEPGKEANVRFSLTVPQQVAPGGYRTGVLFEFGPAAGDPVARARAVMFKSRIASLIYINIGQPPMAGDLTDLRQRVLGGQTQIVATLRNTSRRTVRTKGSVVVYDAGGKVLREAPVPDVPLLPESERDVAIVVLDQDGNITLPPGDYRVEAKVDIGLAAVIVGETTLRVPKK